MAEVIERKGSDGRPRFYVRFVDADGKRRMKASKQRTRRDAERYAAEVEARIARGSIGIPELTPEDRERRSLTIEELARRFLGDVEGVPGYAPPRLKHLGNYRLEARSIHKARILPALGGRAAASVKSADVERMRDDLLARGLAPASAVQALAALSKMYTWGRKVGLIDCGNPVQGVERPRAESSLDYLDAREVSALLAHVEARALTDGATYKDRMRWPMVATAIYAGLRKGELFGLRWRDLDTEARRLTVARSYTLRPKSGKVRHLRINPELVPTLRQWREVCPATDDGLVFPLARERGGGFRMGDEGDMLALGEALAAAGCHVPVKPWHALRHTFASHFIMAGGNILTLQRLLGHSDLKITMIYAHLAPDFVDAEICRMHFTPSAPAGVSDLGEERRRRAGAEARAGMDTQRIREGTLG